ncbi:MAG: tetratricopeptide repeat protein [Acidobacteria bacterium]|nr:tetratricopeptide repeat protein [Acidobacteriota bacterium]
MKNKLATFALSALLAAPVWAVNVDQGVEQFKKHQYTQAESSLAGTPDDDVRGQLTLAHTLAANKKFNEANAAVSKAQAAGAGEAQIKTAKAAVLIGQRDVAGAQKLVNEAIAADPNCAEAYSYRGQIRINNKDFQGAAADLEKAIELDPSQPYNHYYAGMAYNGLKRPDKMVEHLQTFVKMAPDSPDADKVQSLLRAFR